MEEACDSTGTCSQDGHTFKGIFFHHLTLFCSPLPQAGLSEGEFKTFAAEDDLFAWHHQNCMHYGPWLLHNAQAAYMTRDEGGEFGTWWGIQGRNTGLDENDMTRENGFQPPPDDGTDYRNDGVPVDQIWRRPDDPVWQLRKASEGNDSTAITNEDWENKDAAKSNSWDPNDRGRGRTVETQSGGLAILRALWRVVDLER